MNPQAKSICVASSYAIKASLLTYKGAHNPSIISNLVNFGGVLYLALAGSTDSLEQFGSVWRLHYHRAMELLRILTEQREYSDVVRRHVIDALSLTRKLHELIEELAFLLASDDKPEIQHNTAAQWGISLVSVGTLFAAGTDLLEPDTRQPEAVASMLAYISWYALTNEHPDTAWLYEHANEPPMLHLAKTISRSLCSKEFGTAVEVLKLALEPAQQYLTPLHVYN